MVQKITILENKNAAQIFNELTINHEQKRISFKVPLADLRGFAEAHNIADYQHLSETNVHLIINQSTLVATAMAESLKMPDKGFNANLDTNNGKALFTLYPSDKNQAISDNIDMKKIAKGMLREMKDNGYISNADLNAFEAQLNAQHKNGSNIMR